MGEIFVNYVTGNILILKIYEEFLQFSDQQAQIHSGVVDKDLNEDICLKM